MNNYQQSTLHQQVQQLLAVNLLTEGDFEITQNLDNLLEAKFLEKQSFSSSHVKRAQSQGFDQEQTPTLMFGGLNLLKKFDNYHNIASLISGDNNGGKCVGGGPSDYNRDEDTEEDGNNVGGPASSSSSEGEEDDIIDDGVDEDYQMLMQGAGQETIEVLREIERGTNDQRSAAANISRGMGATASAREDLFFSHLSQEEQMLLMSSDPQRNINQDKSNRCTINDQEEDDEHDKRRKSRMTMLIPPPNPLLPKMMLPGEATRNGFLKKFIDLGKRPRVFEKERDPCGPVKQGRGQQQYTPTAVKTILPIGFSSTAQPLQPIPEYPVSNQTQPVQSAFQNGVSQIPTNSEQNQLNQVEDLSNPGNETSLRSFFYMEYRKMQSNEKNPIVFSRFGKQNYDSEEKFCPDSFSQLIRTCNIKRLLKGLPGDMNLSMGQIQQQMQSQLNQYNRFKEENRGEIRTFPQESAPSRPYYIPRSFQDNTLVFESRFECGNLQLAHKLSEKEYNLILQNDLNSKGHTQWFYFRIQNTRKGAKVKFNMLNFLKSKSLYNEGMKVLTYSEKKLENEGTGWHRNGEDISYFQNNYRREAMTNYQRCYYTFTFTYKFEYDQDTVFFAYSQPYSYTDLMDDITEIEKLKLDYVSRNILCRTLAGNRCDYLTITSRSNPNPSDNNSQPEKSIQKKGVVISARVHPGESNSSWMMKGVIDFLVSDCKEAKELRDNFVFKIIPMLNPDGVINGNYRCSLAGCDLNRRWKYPSPILHPTIYTTKQLILQFSKERPLLLYCDLHGHSRRKNVFMYGNSDQKNQEAFRIFPYLMSKISGPLFSYDYSRFKVQRNKEQTARIALWRELKNPNIFTMEASFCGPKYLGPPALPSGQKPDDSSKSGSEATQAQDLNYHYTADDLMEIGKKLCQTITIYNASNIDISKQIEEIKSYHQKKSQPDTSAGGPSSQSIPASAHKSLERNSNLQSSNKSEARKTAFQRRNTAGLETGGSQAPLGDSDSDAVSSGTSFGNFSIKDIMKELKQKMIEEKAAKRVTIVEQDNENDGSSDEDSDSGESEDNLDADQLVQIMPKRIIKKNATAAVSVKRKKGKGGIFGPNPKKVMKEDTEQAKKDDKNATQRRQSIRSLRDFKKPTQSFLQKFGLVGPTNKVKFGQPTQKREFCTQTLDNDESENEKELMECELSAMERDIMLCTGYVPEKLKKLARTSKFDGHHSHMFINLVRLEASRLKGVNTPLTFRKEGDSIIIGKNTAFSIAQIQSPIPPQRMSSSQICSGDENSDITPTTHRIRLDLSKVQDKIKDAKRGNVLGENNGLKNVQVIYSKNEGGAMSAKNAHGYQAKVGDLSVKENSDSISAINGQLGISKANSTQQSNVRDKSAPNGTITYNYENYDTQSTFMRNAQETKKNFRVIDLNNLRQDSTHSLKIAGGFVSQNLIEGTKQKGSIFDNKKRLDTESIIESDFFNPLSQDFKNEPSIIPRSQIAQPVDITQQNAAMASRSLSYHRKVSQPTNSGNIKARLTLQGNQKTPQTLQSNSLSINAFSQQPQQAVTQMQNPSSASSIPRGSSNDSSLKNIWDSITKLAPPKILNAQTTNSISQQSQLSPNVQINNQNRFQQYLKSGEASGLERIEEKQPNNNNSSGPSGQTRSSSQGNYSGTSKFQSMKAKLTPNLTNGKQMQKGPQIPTVPREEHLISAISNRNTVTSISNLNQMSNGAALLTGPSANNGALKKQLQDKHPKHAVKKDRQTMSANQSQYVMGLLHLSSGQQQQAVGQPVTRI